MTTMLYLGERPSEERIQSEIIKIIKKGKIKSLRVNLNRDTIYYEYRSDENDFDV